MRLRVKTGIRHFVFCGSASYDLVYRPWGNLIKASREFDRDLNEKYIKFHTMKNPIQAFQSHFDQSKSRTMLSGGVIFTYLATGKETGGQFMMFEAKGIPGMEPPPHVHTNEDEAFYILEYV